MDVSMSVSLLRDQLGAVIEQAVTAAVETVLGEMAKVVSCKFEEFRKEMSAKEKENENIKQMLEISRCQMKMMRKYLSAVAPKDERQVPGAAAKSGQQSEPPGDHGAPVVETRSYPHPKRASLGDDGTSGVNEKRQNAIPKPGNICVSEGLLRTITWDKVPTKLTNGQECALINAGKDSLSVNGQGALRGDLTGHASHVKVEYRDSEVDDGCQQSLDAPRKSTRPPPLSQTTCAAALEPIPSSLHKMEAHTVADTPSPKVWSTPLQAKEEEAVGDIEIVCIKEEPEDQQACSLEALRVNAGTQGREQQQGWQERSDAPNALRAEGVATAYTAVTGTCPVAPRPARRRQWLKEPNLCEDYKHRRAELKRRSQHRRRELEKNLPQPLLAALVRERREKTRLRVARWRAKRKLQAGLMAPGTPQFGGAAPLPPPAIHIPHPTDSLLGRRQPVAAPQYRSLLFSGSSHGDGGTRYPTLSFGSHPLLPGLGCSATTAGAQPRLTSSVQQGMMGTDSEAYPNSLS
ncbi:uncharacterized protein si:ch211-67e16.4 [Brienomyrus brachyistius]|uniref:uncharacterized protein si:ch211-67e16.4 n=1 Tax=Brienomyrus brachyistius TaxID=42636 RepID=UPI0020B2C794|nr:uncharacterized protein si:ch211-67e16.4 [Brienomyrus brachyistius]